jgi:hypothetical protein
MFGGKEKTKVEVPGSLLRTSSVLFYYCIQVEDKDKDNYTKNTVYAVDLS